MQESVAGLSHELKLESLNTLQLAEPWQTLRLHNVFVGKAV